MAISLLAALGIFLFSIQQLSVSLEQISINKKYLQKLQSSHSFLLSFIITLLCQSSSASITLILILLSTNQIKLYQAFWMMVASNVATTSTLFILLLDIKDILPFLLFFCAVLIHLLKHPKRQIAYVIFYFALLFYSLNLLNSLLEALTTYERFISLIYYIESFPFIFSILLTALLQSSSAVLSILQQLESTFSLNSTFFIILGANIGTTITAHIASLSLDKNAKILAQMHTSFNILVAILGFITMPIVTYFISTLTNHYPTQIAYAHFAFNFLTMLFLFLIRKQINKKTDFTQS